MANIGTLIDFTDGNVLYASQLDSNFGDIRTVVNNAVVHTDKAAQVVTKSLTFTPDSGVAFTVTTGGATITAGDLTLTGDDLIVTAGDITVTAGDLTVSAGTTAVQALTCTTLAPSGTSTLQAVTCTTLNSSGGITGTLQTAAQGNVTSLGTLSALTISGTLTLNGASPIQFASTAKVLSGATSFSIKDSGDSVSVFALTGTGTSTTLTLNTGSSGAFTVTAGTNARLNATSGLILLGTDGTTPKTSSATTGFPCIPHMTSTPNGILSTTTQLGCLVLDEANGCLAVWTSSGWRKIVHASY